MKDIVERLKEPYEQRQSRRVENEIKAAYEIELLRDALAFYAADSNWMLNGPLDPNSGNFTGGPARAVLEPK